MIKRVVPTPARKKRPFDAIINLRYSATNAEWGPAFHHPGKIGNGTEKWLGQPMIDDPGRIICSQLNRTLRDFP
jgi:hypothetical protein